MADLEKKHNSVVTRLKELLDRHRVQGSIALGVITFLTLLASEAFPEVHEFVSHSGIVQYVTLIVLLDLAVSVYLHQAPRIIHLAKNQDESLLRLIEAVPHCRTDGADLLEYAGSTTLPLIRAIGRDLVPLRLLVKHPETISGLQQQRMITTLDTLFNSIFEGYRGEFEIRCYRAPYTLRGRRLGNQLLELGWLTHDVKRQTAYGHANPSLIADLSIRTNDYLRVFFDRTFTDLWNASDTEEGRAVLERLKPVAERAAAVGTSSIPSQ